MVLSNSDKEYWGYDIKFRSEYEGDLGIRLDDNEILNLPNLGFLINLFEDEFVENIEDENYLTCLIGKCVQCLMKCSSFSSFEALWLFKLCLKLLQKSTMNPIPAIFITKLEKIVVELIDLEEPDIKEGLRLHYSTLVQAEFDKNYCFYSIYFIVIFELWYRCFCRSSSFTSREQN